MFEGKVMESRAGRPSKRKAGEWSWSGRGGRDVAGITIVVGVWSAPGVKVAATSGRGSSFLRIYRLPFHFLDDIK